MGLILGSKLIKNNYFYAIIFTSKQMKNFLKLIRFYNLIIIAFTMYAIRFLVVYPVLAAKDIPLQMGELQFFLLVLCTVFIAAGGYIINDYFDVKSDIVNKPNKVLIGSYYDRKFAILMHWIINTIAIFIALYLAMYVKHISFILFQLISIFSLWYYSFYLKKQFLFGNLLISFLTALVPFLAGIYEFTIFFDNFKHFLKPFSLLSKFSLSNIEFYYKNFLIRLFMVVLSFSFFAFLISFVRELIKDMEDIKGDMELKSTTIPIVKGINFAKKLTISVSFLIIFLIFLIQSYFFKINDYISALYLLFFVQLPIIYFIFNLQQSNTKKDFKRLSTIIKIVMITGVSYSFIIFFFSYKIICG